MTDRITAQELRFERRLAAPIDTVWRYLVDPELRARWFMGGAIDPRAGGAIEMVMDHRNLSDTAVPTPERYAGAIGSRWEEQILAIDPPRRLQFTWSGGKAGTVTIELFAEADATRLVLTHTRLRGAEDAVNFGGGWAAHLDVLRRRIAGEDVPDFWALHADAEASGKAALAS